MNKLETQLSRKWVGNLCKEVTNRGERIRLLKTHGEEMQANGISDYLGCWHGRFLAIEFKVYPNEPERNQIDFLVDIVECKGIAMLVTFVPTNHEKLKNKYDVYGDVYEEKQEITALLRGEIFDGKNLHYYFKY